jgi:hypothetical protein
MAVARFYRDFAKSGAEKEYANKGAKTGEKVADHDGKSAIQVFFTQIKEPSYYSSSLLNCR